MTTATLCFIVRDGKILLARKKRGFGEGRWNGPGGKLQEGETPLAAAVREIREEVGIAPKSPDYCGNLQFFFEDGTPDWFVHVFRAGAFDGEPQESEEMLPRWFGLDEIPYDQMWADDPHWLPLLIEGKRFEGRFWFRDDDTMTNFEVHEL